MKIHKWACGGTLCGANSKNAVMLTEIEKINCIDCLKELKLFYHHIIEINDKIEKQLNRLKK
jgi:hypothetical protein